MMILSVVLSLIFAILGLIHLYWMIGGTYGFEQSLPTNEKGEKILNPKKIHIAFVGVGLIAFGIFYALKSGLIDYLLPEWIILFGSWIIPIIFILHNSKDNAI